MSTSEWDQIYLCTLTSETAFASVSETTRITAQQAYEELKGESEKRYAVLGSSSIQRMEALSSTYLLDTLLDKEVTWLGVGGENMQAVVSRIGAYPTFPGQAFTIPATVTSVNMGTSFTLNGKSFAWTSQQGTDLPKLNPVYIDGVKGDIAYSSGDFLFTREEAGDATDVTTSDIIVPENIQLRGCVLVAALGWNGNYDDTDDYVAYNQKVVEMNGNTDFVLITRMTTGDWTNTTTIIEEETALKEKYGANVFAIRDWLSRFGVAKGIEMGLLSSETAQDAQDRADGYVPTSLRSDAMHLTTNGYCIVTQRLYEILNELGLV